MDFFIETVRRSRALIKRSSELEIMDEERIISSGLFFYIIIIKSVFIYFFFSVRIQLLWINACGFNNASSKDVVALLVALMKMVKCKGLCWCFSVVQLEYSVSGVPVVFQPWFCLFVLPLWMLTKLKSHFPNNSLQRNVLYVCASYFHIVSRPCVQIH